MIVTCDHCGAKYNLDPEKVQGRGARITCPKCTHVFTVYKEGGASDAEAAAPVEEPSTEVDVYSLDFKSVGIRSWKVKVKIGLVYDFSDYRTLEKYLREGRVSGTDMLSYNGQDWVNIAEVGDLKAYFVQIYNTFKDNPLSTQDEKKSTEPKLTKNTEEQDEINAAFAAVEAELTGEVPKPNASRKGPPASKSRPKSRSGQSKKAKPAQDLSHLPKERNPLVTIVIGLAVIGGGWFAYASMNTPPVVKEDPVVTEPTVDQSERIRAEIRQQIEDKANLQRPEPAVEAAEPSEEEWIPVVPAEVLAQQGGNLGAVPAPSNSQSPSDYAADGQQKAAMNDWSGAAAAFQKAVDAAPNQVSYQDDLGEALYRSGQMSQAKSVLQRALTAGSVEANKWMGYITREEGDVAGSNQYFQKYLQSNPPDSGAIEQVMRGG